MSYATDTIGDYDVVSLDGEVDLATSPAARELILKALDSGQNVLVDLSRVSYIDSSGVASLVEGFQTARKKQLRFGLVAVSEAVMSVLKLARLDGVFIIHDSVEARIDADRQP